jgi:hypothetical protein
MRNHIRKAALEAGISKRIHWHGFRYQVATWLIANGEDIKVAQELLRHASPHTTLQFYAVASEQKKRDAQERIEDMIFPHDENEPFIPLGEPAPSAEVPLYATDQEKRQALECLESMMLSGRRFLDSESIRSEDASDDLGSKGYSGDQEDYLM